jgi:hypothetical protein
VTNVIVGYALSVAIQIVIFPIIGLKVTPGDSLLIGAVFTVASVIRGFFLRRLFERLRLQGFQREAAALGRTAAQVGMWVGQLPMR